MALSMPPRSHRVESGGYGKLHFGRPSVLCKNTAAQCVSDACYQTQVLQVRPTSAVRTLVNIVCTCGAEVGGGTTDAVQLVSQYLRVQVISRWVLVRTSSLMQAGSIDFKVKKSVQILHTPIIRFEKKHDNQRRGPRIIYRYRRR